MHRRISHTLNTLRQDLAAKLGDDAIHHACRLAGHSWCASCLLTPAAIIHWFLIQVIHGNTALTHVSLLAGRAFTASAFCQARARLPLAVFQTVLRSMVKALLPDTEVIGRWRGHRTFLADGSSFSMPDSPALQAHFGQPGNQAKGCGFPVATKFRGHHTQFLTGAGQGGSLLLWPDWRASLHLVCLITSLSGETAGNKRSSVTRITSATWN